MTMTLLTNL